MTLTDGRLFFFSNLCVCCILSHDRWLEYSFHFDNSTDYLKACSCKISTYKEKKREENPPSYRKNSPSTLVSSRPKFVPAIMISFIVFFLFGLDPITTAPSALRIRGKAANCCDRAQDSRIEGHQLQDEVTFRLTHGGEAGRREVGVGSVQ